MSDYTKTPNLGLFKPTYDADEEMWGNHLNSNSDVLDTALRGGGPFLPLAGGIMTGMLDSNISTTGGQNARFFRYGYSATTPAVSIQSAGSTSDTTNFRALDVSAQTTHDDGPLGAQGIIYASLQVNGKSRVDLYPIHALIYSQNLASDLTPPGNTDGSSQHGGIVAQSVKNAPSGGIPVGKRLPEMFTNWWQTINTSNEGSSRGGADVCLEADIVGNGPDDAWKIGDPAHTCDTSAGSAILANIADTSLYTVGKHVNVSQAGDTYLMFRVLSKTASTVTMDVNAVDTIVGAIIAPQGGTRFSFQNVLNVNTSPTDGGKPLEWNFGHYQNNMLGPTGVATWGVGFAYYGAYYVAASDYSQGHSTASPYSADLRDRGVAIKLAAGQKIAFDGDGYRGTWITGVAGSGPKIVKDGTDIINFNDPTLFSGTGGALFHVKMQVDGDIYTPSSLVVGGFANLVGGGLSSAPFTVNSNTSSWSSHNIGKQFFVRANGNNNPSIGIGDTNGSNIVALINGGAVGGSLRIGAMPPLTDTTTPPTYMVEFRPALNTMFVSTLFASTVGFNNTNPIAKPTVTGAKGSNAALASLLAALAAYGLVTDSTTA